MSAKRKRSAQKTFYEKILAIRKAGLGPNANLSRISKDYGMLPLEERLPLVDKVLKKYNNRKPGEMYAFILYDIENNKIRNHIAKFLLKKGCIRVQKSVFLAELKRKTYYEIYETLKEVNAMYDNHDSIFFIPVGEDILNNMKVVGLNVDFELVTNPKNTMFI
ncbi:MAG: CRISPR-associated endonuclease Cas2 [Bacteroidales bacterium]|nr:CRISPR-associated endonuclease Cas2 [Bacteroidales bacterium]